MRADIALPLSAKGAKTIAKEGGTVIWNGASGKEEEEEEEEEEERENAHRASLCSTAVF